MRYNNPHPQVQQQQMMYQQQQQQQYTPQQLAMMQQQQAQQQYTPHQLAMMQQQLQRQQFQQQQMGMLQEQLMQQYGQYVPQPQQQQYVPQQNRFGNPNQQASVPQGTYQSQRGQEQFLDQSESSSRFGSKKEVEMELVEPVILTGPNDFSINSKAHSFPRNDKVSIKVKVMSITEKNLVTSRSNIVSYFLETPLEEVLESESRLDTNDTDLHFYCSPMVLMDDYVGTDLDVSTIFSGDTVQAYKTLGKLFKNTEEVYNLVWLEKLNNYLTEELNRVLEINFYKHGISVDSFVEDYGALLKAIRGIDDEEFSYEGIIQDFMDGLIKELNDSYKVVKEDVDSKGVVPFTYKVATVVMDEVSHILGLGHLDEMVKLVNHNPDNRTLVTLAAVVCSEVGVSQFLLYSTDCKIWRISINDKAEIFIQSVK